MKLKRSGWVDLQSLAYVERVLVFDTFVVIGQACHISLVSSSTGDLFHMDVALTSYAGIEVRRCNKRTHGFNWILCGQMTERDAIECGNLPSWWNRPGCLSLSPYCYNVISKKWSYLMHYSYWACIYHMYYSNRSMYICRMNYREIWVRINDLNSNQRPSNHHCHIMTLFSLPVFQ